MPATTVRIAGFGGQGVILAGMVIGKAAAIHDRKSVTLIQSFGPEARGSSCSVQLTVSDNDILYPYITQSNIVVVMSQEAASRFSPELHPQGVLLFEQDLIELGDLPPEVKTYGIPATRLAEELGRKLVLNMVMVGFVTAMTELATPEAVRKAVADSVPRGTESLNLAAFEKGLDYGLQLRSKSSIAA
jgi:2-oxoglutarate ferredoxin oxidoreductase subunit gamma